MNAEPDPWDLPERVRTRICDHAYAFPGAEVGGILVGDFPTADHPTTRVSGSLPAFDAQGDLTSLTFTHEAWADIHAMKEFQYPTASIVGWYHSHPGHGIFLSEQDLFIHRNFFPGEASVAYVVDPLRHEEGLFAIFSGEMKELFVRPLDSVEAIAARRPTGRRGPGARSSDAAAQGAASPPPPPPRPASTGSAARADAAPAGHERPAETIARDLGVLLGAAVFGLALTRLVLGG